MKLVPAKCTQCGAELNVDPSKDAAICKYCNTPFVVEKAINNYVTNVDISTVPLTSNRTVDLQSYKTLAYEALEKHNYDVANKYFKQLYEANHADYISKFHIDVLPVIKDTQSIAYIVNTALVYCSKALSKEQVNNNHYSFYERFNIIAISIESIFNRLNDYDEILTFSSEVVKLTDELQIYSVKNPDVSSLLCDISETILPKLGIAFERLKSPAGKKEIRLEKKDKIHKLAEYYNQFRQGKKLPEQFYKSDDLVIGWNFIGKYLVYALILFILGVILAISKSWFFLIAWFAALVCFFRGIYIYFMG